MEADVHQARHWYVTQVMRAIYETSQSQSDIDRRLRELIEYMGWRGGQETLQAYQHYFDPQRHAEIQDRLHQRLNEALAASPSPLRIATTQAEAVRPSHESECDSDLEYLLVLGGKRAGNDRE